MRNPPHTDNMSRQTDLMSILRFILNCCINIHLRAQNQMAIILQTVTHSGLTVRYSVHKRCNADENKFKYNLMKIQLNYEKAALENKTFPTTTLMMKKFTYTQCETVVQTTMEIYFIGLKESQSVAVQMKHYSFLQTQLHCLAYCNMCLVLPVPRVNQFLWKSRICVVRLFLFLDSLPQKRQGNGPRDSPWMLDTCV